MPLNVIGNMVAGVRHGALSNQSPVNEPEVDLYIEGLSTELSETQIGKLNLLVSSLKAGFSITALSEVFDFLIPIWGETQESTLRNLVKRDHDITLSATPPDWTSDAGIKGDDDSAVYAIIDYIPSIDGINYTLNNAAFGLYNSFEKVQTSQDQNGVVGSADGYLLIITGNSASINDSSAALPPSAETVGMHIVTRLDANTANYYIDKSKGANKASTASALPDATPFLLARNYGGAQLPTPELIGFTFASRGLTETEVGVVVDAFEVYRIPMGTTDLTDQNLSYDRLNTRLEYLADSGIENTIIYVSGNNGYDAESEAVLTLYENGNTIVG